MAGIPEVASTSTGYGTGSAASMSQQQIQQTQQNQQAQQTQQTQQTQQNQKDVSAVYTSTATGTTTQNATAENIANSVQKAIRDDYTMDTKDLDNITQELNKLMSKLNPNLQFDYHQEVGVMSVRLLNKETGEVIKELPPEDMVKNQLKRKIWLGAVIGTFIDKIA